MAFFKRKEKDTEEVAPEPEEKEDTVSGDLNAEIIRLRAQIESFERLGKLLTSASPEFLSRWVN